MRKTLKQNDAWCMILENDYGQMADAGSGHHLTLTLCSVLLISRSRMSIVNTPTWFSTSSWWNWLKLLNTNQTDCIPTHRSTLRLPSSRRTLAKVGSRVAWDSKGSKYWACLNRLAMQLAALALSLTSSSYKFSCSTRDTSHHAVTHGLGCAVSQDSSHTGLKAQMNAML